MQKTIEQLYNKAHQLLHLGDTNGFVYADDVSRLNKEVHNLVDRLWAQKGQTDEEEARICLSILMAYNGMIYANASDAEKRRSVFSRACQVLHRLSPTILKCQLLVFCYAEKGEEKFAMEAKMIIDSWEGRDLSREEREVLEVLGIL